MSSRVTVATPVIFLKLKEKPASVGKKVVIPNSLESLKLKARIVLQSPKPIQSVFNESGEQIFSVEELIPSTVVFVSSAPGAQEERPAPLPSRIRPLREESSETKPKHRYEIKSVEIPDMHQGLMDLSSANLSSDQPDDASEEEDQSFLNTENMIRIEEQETIQSDDQYNTEGHSDELLSENEEEEQQMEYEEEPEQPITDEAVSCPEEEEGFAYEEAPEDDHQEEEATALALDKEGILAVQYCNEELPQIIQDVLGQTDPKTKRPYRAVLSELAKEARKEQRIIFQKTLANLPCYSALVRRYDLTLLDALMQRAEQIISKHRVIEPGLVVHNLHSVIVGPRRSGKSILLGFTAERLLLSMFKAQTYKHNFVLIFDAKKLSNTFESFQQFYNGFVDLIFNAVAAQRPGFAQFAEAVISYFKGIGNGVNEVGLPKRFVTHEQFKFAAKSLTQIGSQLQKCYSEPDAFAEWHTNVLLMPSLVASAFGFSQIHYIIDNAEYLEGTISPEFPFVECEEPLEIIEYFKYAISSASYVMACQDIDDFFRIFGPKDDSINLIKNATLFDTFGMKGDVCGSDKAFMVKFEGDPRMFRVSVDDCCGCPAFLADWEKISKVVDSNRDPWNVSLDDYNEEQLTVKEMLTNLFKAVFVVNEHSAESAKIVRNEIVEIRPIKAVA